MHHIIAKCNYNDHESTLFSLQMIIEQLEHERNVMADTIAEKMREHQHLLQVKMDLGMEVAAYR